MLHVSVQLSILQNCRPDLFSLRCLLALSAFALGFSVLLFSASLYHYHADCPDFHQLSKRQHISLKTLPQQKGWWIKPGRDSYLCCYSHCLASLVLGFTLSLINQNSGKTKQKLFSRSVPVSDAFSLCSYYICVLSVGYVCWRLLCHILPILSSFHFLLTTEGSRLDFSETSHYTPHCLYKAKHIHDLPNIINYVILLS